jgi:hypothetical protein
VPATNKPENLVLVLNGRIMTGHKAAFYTSDELVFDLRILPSDEQNKAAWNALLRRYHHTQAMRVNVALGGNCPYYGPVDLQEGFNVLRWY